MPFFYIFIKGQYRLVGRALGAQPEISSSNSDSAKQQLLGP